MGGLQAVIGALSRPSRDATSRIPSIATGCTSVDRSGSRLGDSTPGTGCRLLGAGLLTPPECLTAGLRSWECALTGKFAGSRRPARRTEDLRSGTPAGSGDPRRTADGGARSGGDIRHWRRIVLSGDDRRREQQAARMIGNSGSQMRQPARSHATK